VPFKGQRPRVTFGTNHEGWDEHRAEIELERIMGQIERGTWQPPVDGRVSAASTTAAELQPADETIHVTLSRFWQRKQPDISENTENDYRWRLDKILEFRPQTPTSQINEQWVDELRDHLVRQPARNRKNGERLAPSSVNKVLGLLAEALDIAVDHKQLPYNPARGKRRRVKVPKSKGTFLEPDMVGHLIEEAGVWEAELPEHQRYGRKSLVAVLCLCGPRVSEALAADRGHFDLATGAWRIPDSKTSAGVRTVEVPIYASSELRAHVAEKERLGRSAGSRDPMWVTTKGTRLSQGNVRRMLRKLVKRVNERREGEDKMLLPSITPHALRRTFACLCFWAGRELPWVMDQIGHDDSRMTVGVYAQASQRKRVDRGLVWVLMRFADEPEEWNGSGRNSPTISPSSSTEASDSSERIRGE
jgi:integrase